MMVARVSDQERGFLQFAEKHELRPGDTVQVEERSAEADSVRLSVRNNRKLTMRARGIQNPGSCRKRSRLASHSDGVAVCARCSSRAVQDQRQLVSGRGSIQP